MSEPINSNAELESEKKETEPLLSKQRSITAWQLTILIYFWTCGGPFGIEAAVGAAGACLTIVAIFAICILWAFPQTLLAAELSLMMNVNGGTVVWVQKAFGDFVGFVNSMCNLVLQLSSQALLVRLFEDYLGASDAFPIYVKWGIRAGFVIVTTTINVLSVAWVTRLSWLFFVIMFSPFLVEMWVIVGYRIPIGFEYLLYIPPLQTVDFPLLISTTVWSLGGFDTMGSVAGEVKGGKSTFLRGLMGGFILNIINYLLPIVINFAIDPNIKNWTDNYFTVLLWKKFPAWAAIWMVVASAVANFGQVVTLTSGNSQYIWAMGMGRRGGIAEHRYLPFFVTKSITLSDGSTRPLVAIIINGILILGISGIPFDFLVQVFLVLRVFALTCEYGALITLRFTEPDTHRPFKVPLGNIGPILIYIPTLVIGITTIALSETSVMLSGGSVIVGCILLYPLKLFYKRFLRCNESNMLQ